MPGVNALAGKLLIAIQWLRKSKKVIAGPRLLFKEGDLFEEYCAAEWWKG